MKKRMIKNIDDMTPDEMRMTLSRLMIITNRIYVSAELGSKFCGNHPSIVRDGILSGTIRTNQKNYKRKHPVNVWDCLKNARL